MGRVGRLSVFYLIKDKVQNVLLKVQLTPNGVHCKFKNYFSNSWLFSHRL